MKTKVVILGESYDDVKPKKNIEFVKYLNRDINIYDELHNKPNDYKTIVLLAKEYGNGLDLMYAIADDKYNDGVLFLGHFNDGVV